MGTDCTDIWNFFHYGTPIGLSSTYMKQEEQDVTNREKRLTADRKRCFKTICVTLTTVQPFCVCCGVCACFYVRMINVMVEFSVRQSIDQQS